MGKISDYDYLRFLGFFFDALKERPDNSDPHDRILRLMEEYSLQEDLVWVDSELLGLHDSEQADAPEVNSWCWRDRAVGADHPPVFQGSGNFRGWGYSSSCGDDNFFLAMAEALEKMTAYTLTLPKRGG